MHKEKTSGIKQLFSDMAVPGSGGVHQPLIDLENYTLQVTYYMKVTAKC